MAARVHILLVVVLAAGLLGGCGAATATPPAPASTTTAGPPPGALQIEGAVTAPRTLDAAALSALPRTAVDVTFQSSKGAERRHEEGVLLSALLPPTALALDPARKNDQLALGVVATGADGYAAVVSYGEISPDFGNRGVLVSTAEDGKPLARPRLVVPGDVKGGRYVSDLVSLRVGRVS